MSRASRRERRQQEYEDFLVDQYKDLDWDAARAMDDMYIELGHIDFNHGCP
jgi:hypothetical protein